MKIRKNPYVAGQTVNRQPTQDVIAQEQADDLQGLSNVEEADSESVSELIAEGQSFEAGIPDVEEVKTKEFPADDVPDEYVEDQ